MFLSLAFAGLSFCLVFIYQAVEVPFLVVYISAVYVIVSVISHRPIFSVNTQRVLALVNAISFQTEQCILGSSKHMHMKSQAASSRV